MSEAEQTFGQFIAEKCNLPDPLERQGLATLILDGLPYSTGVATLIKPVGTLVPTNEKPPGLPPHTEAKLQWPGGGDVTPIQSLRWCAAGGHLHFQRNQ